MKKADILKSVIIIATVGMISALSLSLIYNLTKGPIKKQEEEKILNSLSAVLPRFTIEEQKTTIVDNEEFQYWIASKIEKGKRIKGYAFIVEGHGYSSVIKTLVGVDQNFKITGISVLSQAETPGLGARCVEEISTTTFFDHFFGKNNNEISYKWFQEQFKGIDAKIEIHITKAKLWSPELKDKFLKANQISAITGATITTKGILNSISAGMKKLQKALQQGDR